MNKYLIKLFLASGSFSTINNAGITKPRMHPIGRARPPIDVASAL